jgi:type I restriction enzyme S subunit
VPLAELAELTTGSSAPQDKSSFSDTGVRFIRVSDLGSLMGDAPEEPEYLTESAAAGMRLFPAGTVIFAKSGMSSRLNRIVRLPVSAHIVSHLGAVQARQSELQGFLFHWLAEHHPSALALGEAFPSIRMSEVAEMPIPAVSTEKAIETARALDNFQSTARLQANVAETLRMQKRGLVQKLLAGEWRLHAGAAERPV